MGRKAFAPRDASMWSFALAGTSRFAPLGLETRGLRQPIVLGGERPLARGPRLRRGPAAARRLCLFRTQGHGLTLSFRSLASTGRLPAGHQVVLAIANQIGTPHALERITQQRPVVGIVV